MVLTQKHGWTAGMLANHVWSVNKNDQYGDASNTYVQPFLVYTTAEATSFGINTESTYDWEADTWSVPINMFVGQVVKLGKLPVQINGGVRYWAESPANGPEDWGARIQVTFLFPR
ncbi:MAG: hypothetical protein KDA73_02675 [Rhodobacteraceae bacterium]|nr:hypothetical protein [Paracoccaceae bacterium]